jgi:hypothetical protein
MAEHLKTLFEEAPEEFTMPASSGTNGDGAGKNFVKDTSKSYLVYYAQVDPSELRGHVNRNGLRKSTSG